MCNPPSPPPPSGSMALLYVPKLYAFSGKAISKCIEIGSMKFTTLLDYIYIYVCAVTNAFPCNECIFFKCIFFIIIIFLTIYFLGDLAKSKPIRYCIELPL